MCIPSQITCNCYPKVFNAFNVFKVSSLEGIWSMDLLDPFSCQLHHIAFDRLKSHTPLPCPGTQSINITLKFHCVFFILNFTIANTVISKKSYFRFNICWDVIYVQREQQGTKNGALGDTRQNRSPVRFYSIYNNSLLSEAKKKIYPFQCLATDSIAKQFAFKEFMRGCIKCLFKIQYECVNLSSEASAWPNGLALQTSDHGVAGSNPAGGEILPESKRRFIAQSPSCSPSHRLEMTEILLKGRKTQTYPSIQPVLYCPRF